MWSSLKGDVGLGSIFIVPFSPFIKLPFIGVSSVAGFWSCHWVRAFVEAKF